MDIKEELIKLTRELSSCCDSKTIPINTITDLLTSWGLLGLAAAQGSAATYFSIGCASIDSGNCNNDLKLVRLGIECVVRAAELNSIIALEQLGCWYEILQKSDPLCCQYTATNYYERAFKQTMALIQNGKADEANIRSQHGQLAYLIFRMVVHNDASALDEISTNYKPLLMSVEFKYRDTIKLPFWFPSDTIPLCIPVSAILFDNPDYEIPPVRCEPLTDSD